MEFGPSDSSGTDDDLPPTHRNRGARGGVRGPGNGAAPVFNSLPYSRIQNDMDTQIHQLEQEAYCSVLLAFKAQSDVITWEQESLITELRKELRVSDEEHRELLTRVNANDIIRRIRDWRKSSISHIDIPNNVQASHAVAPSPTPSASRKKQKQPPPPPLQSLPSPSPALHSRAAAEAAATPSSLSAKRGAAPVTARNKKQKSNLPSGSASKSMQYPPLGPGGRGQAVNAPAAEVPTFNPLIGRKVLTRWPDDNNFYEAVITDYNPAEGLHALVYDINTKDETWEWVNLNEISPEDIRWEGEDPGIVPHRAGQSGPGRGPKKPSARAMGPGPGRGRGSMKAAHHSKPGLPGPQNGVGKKGADVIEILHTDTLIKAVEKVFSSGNPDPADVEKARRALKGHEHSLIDAIARIADPSDSESGN
ncbi:protein EMSY-LIKE 3-like [Wolffia australiana]